MDGAQYAQMSKSGEFIQMYYRITEVQYNDGTKSEVLQYYSSCGGGWMNSIYDWSYKFTAQQRQEFIDKLIKL